MLAEFNHVIAKSRLYQVRNGLALIGYILAVVWRLWGFSSFLCVLLLIALGAAPRQYLGVLAADIGFAFLLYYRFGSLPLQQFVILSSVFFVLCLLYWWFSRARS